MLEVTADDRCPICDSDAVFKIVRKAGGFYVGPVCDRCGLHLLAREEEAA